MIDGLRPYPKYRPCDLVWLNRLPSHWALPRLGSILQERRETNEAGEISQVLSVLKDTGVVPYEQKGNIGNKKSEDTRRYKIVRPDDIVMNSMNVIIGSVGRSKFTGCLSPVYYVLKRRFSEDDPRYLEAIFKIKPFQQSLVRIGNGILAHRMRIPMELLKCELLPKPPPDEQASIVRFLDHANRRMDQFIRAKKKLIKLLNEQKQFIIHHAITRGVGPNAVLKESGALWFGAIPRHWDVLRSKYVFREADQRSPRGEETHLSMSQKLGLVPSSMLSERRLMSRSYAGGKLCEKGDLVLNRLKAHLGVFAVAPEAGVISPDYTVFRPIKDIEPRYFEALYRSPACRVILRQRAKGIVQGFWRLYTDDFYDIPVPVPPLNEQRAIMDRIGQELGGIHRALFQADREIALMREFLQRLTADLVTGQFDIREAVKSLPPDEPSAQDANDIAEDLDEGDEIEENEDL